jgi:hypothetical protein
METYQNRRPEGKKFLGKSTDDLLVISDCDRLAEAVYAAAVEKR